MGIKIYLAGGFFWQEDDWRYSLVKGLTSSPEVVQPAGSMIRQYWKPLPKAIFDIFDYTGPFPVDLDDSNLLLIRRAIEESDMVFTWVDNLLPSETSKIGFEIGYAYAKGKLIGVAGASPSDASLNDIWIAHYSGSMYPENYIGMPPSNALLAFIDDVIQFAPLQRRLEFRRECKETKFYIGQLNRAGYVYLIKAETGHYKIGRASNIPNRLKLFAVKLPFDFRIVHTFPADDMHNAEAILHIFYDAKRTHGEWFNLTDDEAETIKQIKVFEYDTFFDLEGFPMDNYYEATKSRLQGNSHE